MKSISEINMDSSEGRLLLAALTHISGTSETNKTPDEIITKISALADHMYQDSPPINPVPGAFAILKNAIQTNPDYFIGWQSNMALAFRDEFMKWHLPDSDSVHQISNNAAKNFLNSL